MESKDDSYRSEHSPIGNISKRMKEWLKIVAYF